MDGIIVTDDWDFQVQLRDKVYSDLVGSTLAKTYPGYRWRVESNVNQGIIDIRCEHASGVMGYTFNLVENGVPDTRDIVMAGGEILESFALSRRGLDSAQFLSAPRYLGDIAMVR